MKKLSQNLFTQGIDEESIKQFEEMLKQMNMPQMEIDKVIQPLKNQVQNQDESQPMQAPTQTMQMNKPINTISKK